MTRLELRDLLELRVGWKQPAQCSFTLSDAVKTSNSGRYFQDEHSFVKIETLLSIIQIKNPTNTQLNNYLTDLRKQVSLLVVDEVFIDSDVGVVDLDLNPELFDAAISKRMAMKIAEILWTTTRSNRTERISKEYAQQVFFDVNGDPNFPGKIGIAHLYQKEVKRLIDLFNTENALDVSTLGTIDYLDSDEFYKFS